jgi:hypothetical protein
VDSWGKRRKCVEVCAEAWGVCAIYMQLGLAARGGVWRKGGRYTRTAQGMGVSNPVVPPPVALRPHRPPRNRAAISWNGLLRDAASVGCVSIICACGTMRVAYAAPFLARVENPGASGSSSCERHA